MNPYLFVYGTLQLESGHRMHQVLPRASDRLGTGRVPGRLFDLGPYPGLFPCPEAQAGVLGEVYRLHTPGETFRLLDRYEGCAPEDPEPHAFARGLVQVARADAPPLEAWVYWYRGPLAGAVEIVTDDASPVRWIPGPR